MSHFLEKLDAGFIRHTLVTQNYGYIRMVAQIVISQRGVSGDQYAVIKTESSFKSVKIVLFVVDI